jgi:serine/threonine-protein kinase
MLHVTAADGTGPIERVAEGERQMLPAFFTPDASRIVVHGVAVGNTENDDIAVVSWSAAGAEGAQREARPLLQTTFRERSPALSPDGRWMAYESNESGRDEIYVRPFPDVDRGRWQLSSGGGIQPVWSRDGRELFYRSGAALMAVPVQTGASFAAGNARLLFEGRYLAVGGRNYDVSPDGKRFLMIKPVPASGAQDGPAARFIIVDNWTEELKRLVPAR